MKLIRYILPALVVVAGLVISTTSSYGKAEYTKKEKKPCITCHVKNGAKELNDAGKYYEKNKTLEGFKEKK